MVFDFCRFCFVKFQDDKIDIKKGSHYNGAINDFNSRSVCSENAYSEGILSIMF